LNKKGKLIVFSAPSGSGKTTLVRYILSEFKELVFSVSATTRKKRNNEKNGVDYFFISEEEFKKKIEQNEFIEWEKFYDYYYGTLKSFVDDVFTRGKTIVFELDVKGALSLKKQYPEAKLIFIKPPSVEAIKERLKRRNTESAVDYQKRIDRAAMELNYQDKFDYIVENDNLQNAKEKVKKIVKEIINKE